MKMMSPNGGKSEGLQTRDTWKWWKRVSGLRHNGRLAFGAVLRPFKDVVSTQSPRFMEDGFDLDVVYVTKRIIVHGVPNAGADPMYEDPRTEVRRLLDKYHCNRYKVYNFASELAQMTPRPYVADSRVERYPFTDDTCPPLESVVDFCENAKAWLDAHGENVVSLHCKAGKGRAGIMAACLMVRMGESAHTAVASIDTIQGVDIRRAGMNHRAWVFLYERLITEVWGLRDTIGSVSGHEPGLRAPPRMATGIREVSLQLQVPPRRHRWKQILHQPSCAVYQQTPGGKALVHRARMPCISPRKRGQHVSVFRADMPRSVVVEGTFQVVVSTSTGLFGVGKNVLDAWCNTTFLAEDGGQEMFTFTENDLPPGPLTKRLLAAGVSVVLTHAAPGGGDHRQTQGSDWERVSHRDVGGQNTTAANSALPSVGPVERSVTPETDSEEASDDSAHGRVVANSKSNSNRSNKIDSNSATPSAGDGGGAFESPSQRDERVASSDVDDGRFYLTSDEDDDSTKGTPARRNGGQLQAGGALEPLWVTSSASSWNVLGANDMFVSGTGFATPMSSKCPSPLRSCPRSAISSRKERLFETAVDTGDEPAPRQWPQDQQPQQQQHMQQKRTAATAAPSGILRWASTKTVGAPLAGKDQQQRTEDALEQQDKEGLQVKEERPRAGKPMGSLEQENIDLSVVPHWQDGVAGGHGAGDSGVVARVPRTPAISEPARAHGTVVRLDELGLAGHLQGKSWCAKAEDGRLGKAGEGSVSPKLGAKSSGFRKPSPEVKLVLGKATARSFDELESARHRSIFGSEAVQAKGDGGEVKGVGAGGGKGSSDADSDGDKFSPVARVFADWGDRVTRPSSTDAPPSATYSRDDAEPLATTAAATGRRGCELAGTSLLAKSQGLESLQPLKDRRWPPCRGIVAGVEEVQGALESPSDGSAQQSGSDRPARRRATTGLSWGEDAKLALARKRLQWERSRRGASESGSESLRQHAALVAKREAELLAIETDVKQAVQVLEERIARRESAEAALKTWRQKLLPKAYKGAMSCLSGRQAFGSGLGDP